MSSPNSSFLHRVSGAILRWAAEQRRREQDAQFWQAALNDSRLMADINCAIARSGSESVARPIVASTSPQLPGLLAPVQVHAVSH